MNATARAPEMVDVLFDYTTVRDPSIARAPVPFDNDKQCPIR